jgi:AcrR family transcriptional regulator
MPHGKPVVNSQYGSYDDFLMSRRYEQRRRAELQEATRRRIVEAAIALHARHGLAATTVTDIADLAGVGRQTIYRHFPDELALVRACSGTYWERHPLPDPEPWRAIPDAGVRLTVALGECYAYHRRTEPMMSRILAGSADHAIVRPYHDHWRRAADVIVSAWPGRGRRRRVLRAAVGHAVQFSTWQSLVRGQGLDDRQAAEVMRRLVSAVG